MDRLSLLSVLITGLVILFPALLSLGIRIIPGQMQPSLGTTERIYSTSVVTETFTASRNNLNGIGLSLKNPNYQNKQNVVVSLFSEEGELLGESTVNGVSIPDGDFIKFIFKPVEESRGKNFVFVLSSVWSQDSDATEVFYANEQVTNSQKLLNGKIPCLSKSSDPKVSMIDPKNNPGCTLLLLENSKKANVSYVTFYKSTNPFLAIQEIYLGWWDRLYADKSFFITYLLIVTGLVGSLVLFRRSKSN